MHPPLRRAALFLGALGLLPWGLQGRGPSLPTTTFAAEIARLSEPEGYFDTDNLISNEHSYADVIPALASAGVRGGAYLGVGPDQNFSYIARIRPTFAYIIDIRRDNLLLHLLFKALFAQAGTRAEYLSLLTGRSPPERPDRWTGATIHALIAHVDAPALPAEALRSLRARVDATIERFGVPLSAADRRTIDRFHRTFVDAGLALRFQSHGRPPRPYYPTFRELLLATDGRGQAGNYLASEDDYRFVRGLQQRDRIIPVVGDVGGAHALRAIAGAIAGRGERVSAFYLSNVETYLSRDGAYRRFIQNLRLLPRDERSVMIRSAFGGGSSVSAVHSMNEILARLR